MRKLDIFCPSQASTSICLSMEPKASSSSSSDSGVVAGSASPAIDRYNPIIRDSRRCGNPLPPVSRHKKKTNPKPPPKESINTDREMVKKKNNNMQSSRKSWSCTKPSDFISPPGSTRYLLSGKELLNAFSDFDQVPKPQPTQSKVIDLQNDELSYHEKPAPGEDIHVQDDELSFHEKPASSVSQAPDQVVVLRVSLHCRGCVKKMRKHISRMEGVKSFNIDFAAKKVTVSGKVTALEVLSSISKVKNAQLWAPPTISSEFKGAAAAAAWVTDHKGGSFVGVAS